MISEEFQKAFEPIILTAEEKEKLLSAIFQASSERTQS